MTEEACRQRCARASPPWGGCLGPRVPPPPGSPSGQPIGAAAAAPAERARPPRGAVAAPFTFRATSASVLCCLRSKDPDAAADFLTAVLAAFLEVSGRPEAGL